MSRPFGKFLKVYHTKNLKINDARKKFPIFNFFPFLYIFFNFRTSRFLLNLQFAKVPGCKIWAIVFVVSCFEMF